MTFAMKNIFITFCVLAVGAILIAIPPLGIAVALLFGFLLLKTYLKETRDVQRGADEHRRKVESQYDDCE